MASTEERGGDDELIRSLTRIVPGPSSQLLVIRGSSAQVALAEKLVNEAGGRTRLKVGCGPVAASGEATGGPNSTARFGRGQEQARTVDKIIGYETCPECHGTGVVQKGPCELCNGSGRIPLYEEEEDDEY